MCMLLRKLPALTRHVVYCLLSRTHLGSNG